MTELEQKWQASIKLPDKHIYITYLKGADDGGDTIYIASKRLISRKERIINVVSGHYTIETAVLIFKLLRELLTSPEILKETLPYQDDIMKREKAATRLSNIPSLCIKKPDAL